MSSHNVIKVRPFVVVVAVLCIILACLHLYVANTQLRTIGFAARSRDPNYITLIFGYTLAVLALVNIGWAHKAKTKKLAIFVLLLLLILLPVLYFLSW